MKKMIAMAAMAVLVSAPTMLPTPAVAQSSQYDQRGYDSSNDGRDYRRSSRNDRRYRGRDQRYRENCGSGNGAVGTVAGGVGGGVLGNVLGGGTLGTLVGAGGGALLGRTLDKNNTRAKNRRNNGC